MRHAFLPTNAHVLSFHYIHVNELAIYGMTDMLVCCKCTHQKQHNLCYGTTTEYEFVCVCRISDIYYIRFLVCFICRRLQHAQVHKYGIIFVMKYHSGIYFLRLTYSAVSFVCLIFC